MTARGVGELIAGVATAHAAAADGRPAVLTGLVGRGIGLSRSPAMHQREGARLGLRCTYGLLDLDLTDLADDALGEVLRQASEAGFAGLNVTHPFKQRVLSHLTSMSPEAAAIGAVNTVVFSGSERIGHNTDCWGFSESFRRDMVGADLSNVVLLGAGGGGAAVAHALLQLGVERLAIHDADPLRAASLVASLDGRFPAAVCAAGDVAEALADASGVVNATPVGMHKYPGLPIPPGILASRHWVADIVYFPAETELLRAARARGCRVLAGTGMAVHQAVRAFELFTGVAPDREHMARHFEAA